MSKHLREAARDVIETLRRHHMYHEANIVDSLLDDATSLHTRSARPSGLKKGDKVVMHTCAESENPKYAGRIWTCRTDAFKAKGHDYESIMLEDFSGSFSAEFLQKVNVPD